MISIDFVIALIVGPILVLTCAGLALWLFLGLRPRCDDVDRPFATFFGVLACVVALLFAAGFAWGLFPYDMQYHSYRHVTGTVDTAGSRLLADGKATTQNYAIRLAGSGATYRCDDTRCALAKRGDQIALWCIREWQYAATSGWVCNFDRSEVAA